MSKKNVIPQLARVLELTDPEVTKLYDFHRVHRKRLGEYFEDLREIRQALFRTLAKPNSKRTDIAPFSNKLIILETKIINERVRHMYEIKSMLSPRQFDRLLRFKDVARMDYPQYMERMKRRRRSPQGKGVDVRNY